MFSIKRLRLFTNRICNLKADVNMYDLVIHGYDWGPGANKIILHLKKEISMNDLRTDDFQIMTKILSYNWTNFPPKLETITGHREITDVYTSDEKDEYNLGSWEGNPLDCFASIITGVNVENVKIIGQGVIDGNANNGDWWVDVRTKRIAWRPRGLFLNHCKNVNRNIILPVS